MTEGPKPPQLEKTETSLTTEECSKFLENSYYYSRGDSATQSFYFDYAVLVHPEWKDSLSRIDSEAVKNYIRKVLGSYEKSNRHVAVNAAEVPVDAWDTFFETLSNGPGIVMENDYVKNFGILGAVAIFLIRRDGDYLFLDEDNKRRLRAEGRKDSRDATSNWQRSFLYDYAMLSKPLRGSTHPVFVKMFEELKLLIAQGGIMTLDVGTQNEWQEIVHFYETEVKK